VVVFEALTDVSGDSKLMAVSTTLGADVIAGVPHELFPVPLSTGYAPSSDGQHFLLNVPAGGEGATTVPLTVVLNWTTGLKK
jgi:hypothetical protein